MSRNGNSRGGDSRAASPRAGTPRKGGSMLAAVLFGMVLGLILAGGVAWYMLERPSPFQNNVAHEAAKLEPAPSKPAPAPAPASAPAAKPGTEAASGVASGVAEDKPRFEFYTVLTDNKQDGAATTKPGAKPADKPAAPQGKYYLQAGAFANAGDADKLKAKLAMMGMEASVQAATLPDKSVWHRVRLGPYKSSDEMNKAVAQLKQNGVRATPVQ